jgi:hypothetical protein
MIMQAKMSGKNLHRIMKRHPDFDYEDLQFIDSTKIEPL